MSGVLDADDRRLIQVVPPEERMQPLVYYTALAAILIAGVVLMLALFHDDIARRSFRDPDDLMRLQQVRDWLAGQSWFDVTQYRISPRSGLHMHWSRLLDAPIGAIVLAGRPLVGPARAELLACVAAPLITLACLVLLVAAIARKVLRNDQLALVAAGFCFFDFGIYWVARPLRIDHHGWQAVCGLTIVLCLVGRRTLLRTALAGVFAALWMHISLEGLVFTAAAGAWLGVRWLLWPSREGPSPPAFLAAIAATSLALFLVAHGGSLFDRTFCDAVSPVHMTMFALAATGTALCLPLAERGIVWRAIGLGVTLIAAGATYKLWAPQCGGGPFASLGPLSYRLWYLGLAEGLPIWNQPVQIAVMWNGVPLLGIIGAAVGLRRQAGDQRGLLTDYIVLLIAATVIGFGLLRASALAGILALPGLVLLLQQGWAWARGLKATWARIPTAAAITILLLPITPVVAAAALIPDHWNARPQRPKQLTTTGAGCLSLDNLHHLDALPPSLLMTTLDSAPALIVATRHSAVGGGYHRDGQPMEDVIRFFTADDATARKIAGHYQPAYVFICPGDGDSWSFSRAAPGGLAARLVSGAPPAWLQPVSVSGLRYARVYRLID